MAVSSSGAIPMQQLWPFQKEVLALPELAFSVRHSRRPTSPEDPVLDGMHIHDSYEAYVHVSGSGAFLVNNLLYPLRRGDIIFTRPGDVHVLIIQEPCLAEHYCLWLDSACGDSLIPQARHPDFGSHLHVSGAEGDQMLGWFQKLTAGDPQSPLERAAIVLQIVLLLSRTNEGGLHSSSTLSPGMQDILDYMHSSLRDIGSIQDIAAHFHISTATLNRWFRQQIHVSPQEFLRAKRLACARQCLDSGATVTESCMRSGFSDCSYFISVFRQTFGMTPRRYQHRNDLR